MSDSAKIVAATRKNNVLFLLTYVIICRDLLQRFSVNRKYLFQWCRSGFFTLLIGHTIELTARDSSENQPRILRREIYLTQRSGRTKG